MILDNFSLKDKVAVVTGCDTGLGQGMVLGLAEAGATVVGINKENPSETEAMLKKIRAEYYFLSADLSRKSVIDPLIEKVLACAGKIDILVNNAGIIRRENSVDFSEKDWDEVMDLNAKMVFFLSQAAAKQYIKQGSGGKIINICSMLSFQGGIRVPSYTASKSAVAGLTRLMANEWAEKGINVNGIAPGYMETNNTAPLLADKERTAAITARIPAGYWGKPEDLKGLIVFLSSQASKYVHGAIIPVDGGWLAR